MVLLITTTPILSALETLPSASRKDLNLPDSPKLESPISHEQLIRLARYLRTDRVHGSGGDNDDGGNTPSLSSLLQGTKVYVPPPPKRPEPSPEYLASKARLLAAAEAEAYNRLMNPTTKPPTILTKHTNQETGTDTETDQPDPLTPSLVLNIFLSVVITGFSVYFALTSFQTPEFLKSSISSLWASPSATGKGRGNAAGPGVSEPIRVLVSFVAALVVGVAEVMLYVVYLEKVDRARGRERRIKERKVVIGREEVGGRRGKVSGEEKEKEDEKETAIWGRGVNGGVRRRVREKWEMDTDKDKE